MDPLIKLPEELGDFIFQHLTVDELLQISLVSFLWYQLTAKSRTAKLKVWLNAGDRFFNPPKNDFKIFINSPRNYENFRISEMENGLLIILFPRRKWKRAQLDIQSFITYKEYVKLLECIESSIQELAIFDMTIEEVIRRNYRTLKGDRRDPENCEESVRFENLKKLKLGSMSLVGLKPFIKNLPKLSHLVIEDIFDFATAYNESEVLQQILSLNKQITCLAMSPKTMISLFNADDLQKNSFQYGKNLEKLIVEFDEGKKYSYTFRKNLETFLNIQQNLTWLVLCDCCEETIFVNIINSLKSLKRLSVDYFDASSFAINPTNFKFDDNNSIKYLDFDADNLTLSFLKPFLLSCKQVEVLYVFHLAPDIFNFLLTSDVKTLKVAKYCSISKEINEPFNSKFDVVEEKFVNLKKVF